MKEFLLGICDSIAGSIYTARTGGEVDRCRDQIQRLVGGEGFVIDDIPFHPHCYKVGRIKFRIVDGNKVEEM